MDFFSFVFGVVSAVAVIAVVLFVVAIGQYNKRSKM